MKSAKRVAALALSLAMCGTLFAGCGNNQNTPSSTNDGGAGSHPGVLNVHIETNVQSMDPQEATDGTSFEVIAKHHRRPDSTRCQRPARGGTCGKLGNQRRRPDLDFPPAQGCQVVLHRQPRYSQRFCVFLAACGKS